MSELSRNLVLVLSTDTTVLRLEIFTNFLRGLLAAALRAEAKACGVLQTSN
jgi:hypothetical protein